MKGKFKKIEIWVKAHPKIALLVWVMICCYVFGL